jgi:multicomponent Na+:H+ antiporter subunit D
VSLSLIHRGLLDNREFVPYALMLVAQVITIAALGRAAWLAFFRERDEEYERSERLRPGMLIGLSGLSLLCLAFGVLPGAVLDHMMAPAAASLLNAGRYASAVLAGTGTLPRVSVEFHYADPTELLILVASLLLGLLLTRAYLRSKEDSKALLPVRALRALHTGSVNDYAAYAVVGALIVIASLRWA